MQQLIRLNRITFILGITLFMGILCTQRAESPQENEEQTGRCKNYAGRTITKNPILFSKLKDTVGQKIDLIPFARARACLTSEELKSLLNSTRIKVELFGYSQANDQVKYTGFISSHDIGFSAIELQLDRDLFSGKWVWRENDRDDSVSIYFDAKNGKAIRILENVSCKVFNSAIKCEDYRPGNFSYFAGDLEYEATRVNFTPIEFYGMNSNPKATGVSVQGTPIRIWRCGTKSLCAPYPMRKVSSSL